MSLQITICGARLHNLKNINLMILQYRLVVPTGVLGSGKSAKAPQRDNVLEVVVELR